MSFSFTCSVSIFVTHYQIKMFNDIIILNEATQINLSMLEDRGFMASNVAAKENMALCHVWLE